MRPLEPQRSSAHSLFKGQLSRRFQTLVLTLKLFLQGIHRSQLGDLFVWQSTSIQWIWLHFLDTLNSAFAFVFTSSSAWVESQLLSPSFLLHLTVSPAARISAADGSAVPVAAAMTCLARRMVSSGVLPGAIWIWTSPPMAYCLPSGPCWYVKVAADVTPAPADLWANSWARTSWSRSSSSWTSACSFGSKISNIGTSSSTGSTARICCDTQVRVSFLSFFEFLILFR